MKLTRKTIAPSLARMGLIVGVASTALYAASVAAQTDDPKAELAQNVDAFYKACPQPPLDYSTDCYNELGVWRQKLQNLHLTYQQLKDALPVSSRGGRWP
jgi:hypothetical protein